MTRHALFLQHRTKPGMRDVVQKVWQRHMQPAIAANVGHEIYIYSFASDPDRICAFQVYRSLDDANAFLETQEYRDYLAEVEPLLDGPPEVEVLQPQWMKPAAERGAEQCPNL